jgi:hypothetical protein
MVVDPATPEKDSEKMTYVDNVNNKVRFSFFSLLRAASNSEGVISR